MVHFVGNVVFVLSAMVEQRKCGPHAYINSFCGMINLLHELKISSC